jgi:CubicO group peptidase (beta-lactamase class C family)
MRSGLADYDDLALQAYSLNPAIWPADTTPYDYLHRFAPKSFLFDPGTGGSYSSIGFVLAGFAAAAATGVSDWDALDQGAVLAAAGADGAAISAGLLFAKRGACSADANVTHQYLTQISQRESKSWNTVDFVDIRNMSCLNGWTMGNLAAAPESLAALLFEAFSPNGHRLLSAGSLAAMQDFHPLTTGWSTGLQYGLGAMKSLIQLHSQRGLLGPTMELVGHGGQDWGSGAPYNFYSTEHDFAFVVATNSLTPMNCSDLNGLYGVAHGQDLAGQVGNCLACEALQFKSNGTALPEGEVCPCTPAKPSAARTPETVPASWHTGAQLYAAPSMSLGSGAAVVGTSTTSPVPYVCPTGACAGGLSADECSAWKDLYVGIGLRDTSCLADPCGATAAEGAGGNCGATCVDGHITAISLPSRGLVGNPFGAGRGLAALVELTSLDVSNNTLFGELPADLSEQLPKLARLDVHGNLFSGKLPGLNYTRLAGAGGYCDVSGNDFDCPVPTGAAACASSGGVPTCSDAPVSAACLRDTGALYVDAIAMKPFQFVGDVFAAAGQQCGSQFGPGHMVCSVNASAMWTANSDAWHAYTDARTHVRSLGGDVCWVTLDTHQDCSSGVPCEIAFAAIEPLPFGAGCDAEDRSAWAAWQGRPSQCLKTNGADATCNQTITYPLQCGKLRPPTPVL